jgi:peptidoglycan/LPS O-acetylase OafA/YrhL
MYPTKDKNNFWKISVLYSLTLLLFSLTTYLYYDFADGKTSWMIFSTGTFLLTIFYFRLLQLRVRKREYPPITSLAGICIMGGLAIGIFILLIVGVSTFQPYMWTMFSIIYIAGTIWTAKKLWTKTELRQK